MERIKSLMHSNKSPLLTTPSYVGYRYSGSVIHKADCGGNVEAAASVACFI